MDAGHAWNARQTAAPIRLDATTRRTLRLERVGDLSASPAGLPVHVDTGTDRRVPGAASMIRYIVLGLFLTFLGLFGLYFISE
jgi:hypothetical protein